MNQRQFTIRAALVIAMLLATGSVLYSRNRGETLPNSADLNGFPSHVQNWKGTDQVIAQDVLDTLGAGHFLSRFYTREDAPPIDLFIAYYPSQRSGDAIHSPKNCLPGSGWFPIESGRTTIDISPQQSIAANRYVVARGGSRQLVIYWYQAHGRTTASEYSAKIRLVVDAIRMNRSDGAMVRLVTPMLPNENTEESQRRLVEFARSIYQGLDTYIPR